MSGVPNLKYKTSLCNAWRQGLQCAKGEFCFFAHGQGELRTMEQNRNICSQLSSQVLPQGSYKFKTTYCKFYSKGDCKLGQSCSFAHNKSEKRQKSYIPKQQALSDPNMYYYCQYFPECPDEYVNQIGQMYQYYPHYPQPQTSGTSPESQKSQQRQDKEEQKHPRIDQTKTETSVKGSPSM